MFDILAGTTKLLAVVRLTRWPPCWHTWDPQSTDPWTHSGWLSHVILSCRTQNLSHYPILFSKCIMECLMMYKSAMAPWLIVGGTFMLLYRVKQNILTLHPVDRSITWPLIWLWLESTTNIALCSIVSKYIVVKFLL